MRTVYEHWAFSPDWDDEFLDRAIVGDGLWHTLDGLCWC